MDKQELISVIVPIYNVEKYLRRCIDSIINQTYTNLEIILVDDGSPDGCGVICDEYAKRDKRIKVIHKGNGGVSSARNSGLETATGNYIAFIDSDDFIEEDYIETLYINIGNADIISSNFKMEYDVGTVKRNYKMPSQVCIKTSKEEFFSDCIDAMIYTYVIWGKLYRKDILGNIRFENQAYSEDALFVRRIFLNCGTMRLIPYDGYNYFIGNHSATSDKKRANEKMAGELNMLLYTWSMCKNNEININYIVLEKKICNTLNSILKHSLRYPNEFSSEVCEVLKKSLKAIKSFRSVKHLQYFGVYFIVRILITIERIKYNR